MVLSDRYGLCAQTFYAVRIASNSNPFPPILNARRPPHPLPDRHKPLRALLSRLLTAAEARYAGGPCPRRRPVLQPPQAGHDRPRRPPLPPRPCVLTVGRVRSVEGSKHTLCARACRAVRWHAGDRRVCPPRSHRYQPRSPRWPLVSHECPLPDPCCQQDSSAGRCNDGLRVPGPSAR
jgi:hypothetical protein